MSNKKSSVAKTKVNKTKDGQATKQAQATNKLKIKTKLDNKFLNEYLMKHEGKETVDKPIPKVKELYNMYDDYINELEKEKTIKGTPPLTLEQKKSLEDTARYVLSENGWIKEYPMRYTGGNNFFSSIINWFKNLFK